MIGNGDGDVESNTAHGNGQITGQEGKDDSNEQPVSLPETLLYSSSAASLFILPSITNAPNVPGGIFVGALVSALTGVVNIAFDFSRMSKDPERPLTELVIEFCSGFFVAIPQYINFIKNPFSSNSTINWTLMISLGILAVPKNSAIYGQQMPESYHSIHEYFKPNSDIAKQQDVIKLLHLCYLNLTSPKITEEKKETIKNLVSQLHDEEIINDEFLSQGRNLASKTTLREKRLGKTGATAGDITLTIFTATLIIPCIILAHIEAMEANVFGPSKEIVYTLIFLTISTMAYFTRKQIQATLDERFLMGCHPPPTKTPSSISVLSQWLVPAATTLSWGGLLAIFGDAPTDLEPWNSPWNILCNLMPALDQLLPIGSGITISLLLLCFGVVILNMFGAVFQLGPEIDFHFLFKHFETPVTTTMNGATYLEANQPDEDPLYPYYQIEKCTRIAQGEITKERQQGRRLINSAPVVKFEKTLFRGATKLCAAVKDASHKSWEFCCPTQG